MLFYFGFSVCNKFQLVFLIVFSCFLFCKVLLSIFCLFYNILFVFLLVCKIYFYIWENTPLSDSDKYLNFGLLFVWFKVPAADRNVGANSSFLVTG